MRDNRNNNQNNSLQEQKAREFHSLSAIRIKKDMFILNPIHNRAHSIHHISTSSKPAISRKLTYISIPEPKIHVSIQNNQVNTSILSQRANINNSQKESSSKIITSAR